MAFITFSLLNYVRGTQTVIINVKKTEIGVSMCACVCVCVCVCLHVMIRSKCLRCCRLSITPLTLILRTMWQGTFCASQMTAFNGNLPNDNEVNIMTGWQCASREQCG